MAQVGLVIVEKTFLGEIWTNTHALAVPGLDPPLNIGGLDEMTGGVSGFPDAYTDPSSGSYGGSLSPLAAILGFERLVHGTQVQFTRLYVSDGKTPGSGTGAFATFPLNFAGLGLDVSDNELAPLSIVLQINRVPVGYSTRSGRLQLRAALTKGEIKAGQIDGVSILPASLDAVTSRIADALTSSNISGLFSTSSDVPQVAYAIPHYYPASAGSNAGAISGYSPVSDMVVKDAASRQVQRGRKKTGA